MAKTLGENRIMCGRYANHVHQMGEWVEILRDWPEDVETGYNIAPTQIIPAFTPEGGKAMRWGLVPHWSKEASPKYATFNARVESAAEKPAFRGAWKQSRTCLIPALGYYEWKGEKGNKQPYFVRPKDGDLMVMAGLWETWQRPDQEISSCTILTQSSQGNLIDLHHRMPIMLQPEQAERWLEQGTSITQELVEYDAAQHLKCYPVSKTVNRSREEGESLTEPLTGTD